MSERSLIDISVPVGPRTPVWPGSPRPDVERVADFDRGDDHVGSRLKMDVHTGTHVDAPLHFIAGGGDVEGLSLDALVGPCVVVDFGDAPAITPSLLDAEVPAGTKRLLCKTSNSARWDSPGFDPDFVALTPAAAAWIADHGVRLVGVDYLSVQRFHDEDNATHERLLRAGVVIVEGLNLSAARPGPWELICLPLRLVAAEGAPARAVLRALC